MRNAFWLALIAGSLAAIVAGYVQASLQTRPPPVAQLRAAIPEAVPAVKALGESETSADDVFSRDDVVVERERPAAAQWQPERLRIVVGLCGNSLAAETGFLRLNFPLAFVVDAAAPQAREFAGIARSNGDEIFVQVDGAPSAQALSALERTLGPLDGVASRNREGMALALRGTGLAFFDERGNASDRDFAIVGVPLVRRDVTADDRSSAGYIAFMLARAAGLSRRAGPVVVFLRPLPSSLSALREFSGAHNVRMIALR